MNHKFATLRLLFILIWMFVGLLVQAQNPIPTYPPTTGNPENDTITEVEILFSEYLKRTVIDTQEITTMRGKVRLQQDDALFRCDSAAKVGNYVNAFGNIVIQQSDTVKIFSDKLFYDGDKEKALLLGEVVLTDSKSELFTSELNYNLETKIATYDKGAILKNEETLLRSKKGYYYINAERAYFKDSVVVVDPEFSLTTDTLMINTETNVTYFLGPTNILNKDGNQIYASKGFYDPTNKYAEFEDKPKFKGEDGLAEADKMIYDGVEDIIILKGNAYFKKDGQVITAPVIRFDNKTKQYSTEGDAEIVDGNRVINSKNTFYDEVNEVVVFHGDVSIVDTTQILTADSVRYDQLLQQGTAYGNVVWEDTVQKLTIICDSLSYNDSTGYVRGFGRPYLMTVLDEDTLYMAADRLYAEPIDSIDSDSARLLVASGRVRIYKSDLQAICDSMAYNSVDSIFQFFKDPIIWSDTSQFTADSINVLLQEEQIHKIFLNQNSFIINSPDEIYFNQIKGKAMIANFLEGEIDNMEVLGNGESVYYALNEQKEYIAVNKTICSEMLVRFGDNEVRNIVFFTAPEATLFPMQKADHQALRMDGFKWEKELRPKSKDDLR